MPEYKVLGKRLYLSRSRLDIPDDTELEVHELAVEPGDTVDLPEHVAEPLSDRLERVEDEEGN